MHTGTTVSRNLPGVICSKNSEAHLKLPLDIRKPAENLGVLYCSVRPKIFYSILLTIQTQSLQHGMI